MTRLNKLLFAVALVASLATGLVSAHASPLAPTKALDAYPCETTQFIKYTGNQQSYFDGSYIYSLKSAVWVEVDPTRGNLYCGAIQSEGDDQLGGGCVHFNGDGHTTTIPETYTSFYDVYHCTQTSYTFYGPVSDMTCNSGQHIQGEASTDEVPGFIVYSSTYNC